MRKRILFVEDDPLMIQLFVLMMEDESNHWEVTTAEGAREALQIMERSPFDVVVSDMNMPGMSGAEFINEVKVRYPRSSRIIMSALNDQQRVAGCLGATHQFLAKPFDVKVFKDTLARIGGLDHYLKDERLRTLVGRIGSLPSFPSLYVEIMKDLDSPDSLIENVAATVGKDPAMTAKMLQIVNSAAIGLSTRINNPFEAVSYLGLGTVRSLVLSAHIFTCFEHTNLKGFSISRLWNHAMGTGALARMIMQLEQADATDSGDAFTAGLLHDIGKLMLADGLPDPFQQALTLAAERNVHLYAAELEVFGATHAGVAAYLLGLWGLPASLVEAVALHHTPGQSDVRTFGPLVAVHVANVLEQELSQAEPSGQIAKLDDDYLAAVGVQNRVEVWRGEAERLATALKDDE